MKRLFTILAAVLLTATIWAQSPQLMSYQAVIRDLSNHLVTTQVGMRITILLGPLTPGTNVYVERQITTPNANGLVTIQINGPTVTHDFGTFAGIDWSAGEYYIKTETDISPGDGSNYTITGTSQLLSVPYAFHSKTVASYTELDPAVTNNFDFTSAATNDLLKFNGTKWVKFTPNYLTAEVDGSITNEIELPTQSGNSGKFLSTNGTIPSWLTLPTADGSETKVTAGTNVTITGSGTTANPYVIGQIPGTVVGQMLYWNGSAWINVTPGTTGQVLIFISGVPTWGAPGMGMGTNDVYNPKTGKIWMDRNLGATQVATSSTDANSYGYLYQWGRGNDGHQNRTSLTTIDLSSSDIPAHGNFIVVSGSPYDWRSSQNDNLWQGVNGTNNPCPNGYRLPTDAEWNAERLTWSTNNAAGAFASPLKLPLPGYRNGSNGSLTDVGINGSYWGSTVSSTTSRYLYFISSDAYVGTYYRAYGFSVRCIKE